MRKSAMVARDWSDQLLAASARQTTHEVRDFLNLVDEVDGRVTPAIAQALMATFSAIPDHGTQERVLSVLASAPNTMRVGAILGELPRLVAEAPEWADALLCQLLEHDIAIVRSQLSSAGASVRFAVRTVAARPDFQSFQPAAKSLL
jgi:hypothetical protein